MKSPLDSPLIPGICSQIHEIKVNSHPYLQACSLPLDHEEDHWLRPAHHMVWEHVNRVFEPGTRRMFPVGLVLRPRDENWINLNYENWEVTTTARINREIHGKEPGVLINGDYYKFCTHCYTRLRIDEFPVRRNICTNCHKHKLRDNSRNRYKHEREFGCRIVNGRHYHLKTDGHPSLNFDTAIDYYMDLFFTRLRDKPVSVYKREVTRVKNLLEDDDA